ncbi:MAG: S9 family peptidase [Bacteroidia bacterium]|nr:S9 family peptidase [Bacteroidia bacterium]
MKKQIFFLTVFYLFYQSIGSAQRVEVGNLVTENIPEIPASIKEELDRYNNIRTASFSGWLKKEKGMLIVTRFAETNQIHLVREPMGDRKQITFEKEPLNWASVCPDSTRNGFIFGKDIGGNENFQFYYYDLEKSEKKLLTDGKSRHGSLAWSYSGKRFAFTSNKRNPADMDFYLTDFDTPEKATMILERKGGGWGISDWSPDEKRMILQEYISVNKSNIYIFNLESKELTLINDSSKQVAFSEAFFSVDGNGIFLVSDEGREFAHLRYYDLTKKSYTWSLPEMGWNVQGVAYNRQRTRLIFRLNKNGYSEMFTMDPKGFEYKKMTGFPDGIVGNFSFSRDGKLAAYNLQAANQGGDVYVYDLATSLSTRWTESEAGDLNRKEFVTCAPIYYSSFDSVDAKPRQIPALIYKPKGQSGKKLPVLISIHGGPESQSTPTFNSNTQFLLKNLEIAIVVPNVRGSTGYGKTFTQLDNGFLRLNSVKDIESLINWIRTQPDLDTSRVAVMGGSYGGTMVLMCMTELGHRIRCGVDLFGSSNLNTFLKNTSSYRQDLRRVEYGDERDPEMYKFLERIAPLNNLDRFTKPIFIYQGKNDPRVPLSESEQIVEALKKKGSPVWYVMAKDEGHGLAKKATREYTNAAIALFLQEYLIK